MQAVVLVGGKGSRLGSLTTKTPKPMLEVAGKPFIHLVCRHLELSGFTDIVLLAGFEGHVISRYFKKAIDFSARITVVVEPEPLGTGGALRHAESYLQENFLLLNGDTWFDIPLGDFFAPQHLNHPKTLMRMALRRYGASERFGTVSLAQGLVTGFGDIETSSTNALVNCGTYVVRKDFISHIPVGSVSLENEVMPALIAQKMVAGDVFNAPFIDIGIPEDFKRSQNMLPTLCRKQAIFLQEGAYSEFLAPSDMNRSLKIAYTYGDLPRIASTLGARIFVVRQADRQFSLQVLTMGSSSGGKAEDIPDLIPLTGADFGDYVKNGVFFGSDQEIFGWLQQRRLCDLMCPSLNVTSFFTSNFLGRQL